MGYPIDKTYDLDYKPYIGGKKDYGIGIIGCGGIVQSSHLPAYREAGFRLAGIFNRDRAVAEKMAAEFGIERVFNSAEELLDSREVEVADIALPPHLNLEFAAKACEAGKPFLIQKPLALHYCDAVEIVRLARAANVKMAVNQNGRWDPAIRASKTLIDRGLLGQRLTASIELRTLQPWQGCWQDASLYQQMMIIGMSIHHLDQFRFLFGEPNSVQAITQTYEGQKWGGDSIAHYWLRYADGFVASGLDDGYTWTNDYGIRFRFTGSEGVIKGSFGWPDATYSTLQYTARENHLTWIEPKFDTKWFPHAFIGTMGDLFHALETNGQPTISGEDNLKTMALVFACYRSNALGRVVYPSEVSNEGAAR